MAVALNQIQVSQKDSALDKVLKGVQVAAGLSNIYGNVEQGLTSNTERQNKKLAQENLQQGVTDEDKVLALAGQGAQFNKLEPGQTSPTAITRRVLGEVGQYEVSAPPKDNKDKIQQAQNLRNDYLGNTTTKRTSEIDNAYSRILESSKIPSAAGDISLVYSFMKINDPGSTVREGEFATAQNAAGISDRLRAQYNSIINGERLSTAQRKDFIDQAKNLYTGQVKAQEAIDSQFKKTGDLYGLKPEEYLIKPNQFSVADLNKKTEEAKKELEKQQNTLPDNQEKIIIDTMKLVPGATRMEVINTLKKAGKL